MEDRQKRLELCEKSLIAFGSKYRWKHIIEKGSYVGEKIYKTVEGEWPANARRKVYLNIADVENLMDQMIAVKKGTVNE